jgi:hypothetical protein
MLLDEYNELIQERDVPKKQLYFASRILRGLERTELPGLENKTIFHPQTSASKRFSKGGRNDPSIVCTYE